MNHLEYQKSVPSRIEPIPAGRKTINYLNKNKFKWINWIDLLLSKSLFLSKNISGYILCMLELVWKILDLKGVQETDEVAPNVIININNTRKQFEENI